MIVVDGSYGEGGGQLVRTAVALAAITGESVRLTNIRARRAPPGLAPQHVTAVRSVASLCAARVEGLEVRSQELVFYPGKVRGGQFEFNVGTAGSITLVLQAVLPVALVCDVSVYMRIMGGTDVKMAPPLDYLRYVMLPLLTRMGADVRLTLKRRGYYPRGGGEIEVTVQPGPLRPLCLETVGTIESIQGVAHISNLPAHIVERMQHTAIQALSDYPHVNIETQVLGRDQAIGQGGAIVLWAMMAYGVLGGAEVAQRGIPAERIALNAAEALRAELLAGAAVDVHAADQLLIYCALAEGPSSFVVRTPSSHARTTLWLLGQFLPLRVNEEPADACIRLELAPG